VPKFTGVSHVELTVRDADRSASWYEQVLCMKRRREFPEYSTPGVAARVVQVMNPAAGLDFGLIQHDAQQDGEYSEFRVGLDHLELTVASRRA
jgi:glyoxylase I family protein